jgi:hypothetical protein
MSTKPASPPTALCDVSSRLHPHQRGGRCNRPSARGIWPLDRKSCEMATFASEESPARAAPVSDARVGSISESRWARSVGDRPPAAVRRSSEHDPSSSTMRAGDRQRLGKIPEGAAVSCLTSVSSAATSRFMTTPSGSSPGPAGRVRRLRPGQRPRGRIHTRSSPETTGLGQRSRRSKGHPSPRRTSLAL